MQVCGNAAISAARSCGDGECLARLAEPVDQPHLVGLLAGYPSSGEHEIHRPRLPDQPRQPDGAAVDERDTPAAAEDTEDRIAGRHAQVGPDSELETTGDRIALDRRDDRLGQPESAGTHRTVAVGLDAVAATLPPRP